MKPHHFIAPILALIAIIFVVDRQENTMTTLRDKTAVARERLEKVADLRTLADHSRSENGAPSAKTDQLSLPDGSPDWEAIFQLTAKTLNEGGGWTDLSNLPEFQKRVSEMSEVEIADGIAKIQDLDLSEKSKQHLKGGLLLHLANENPQLTLELIGDAISDRKNPLSWTQQYTFLKFAKDDPVAAMTWLDREIDEGKLIFTALDPIDNPRFWLEAALIGQLIETDLTTAKARVATFSEKERTQLFSNSNEWRREGKMPLGFLTLARDYLSEDQATKRIANAWATRSNSGLTAVDEALDQIPFSNKERKAIVTQSVSNFTRSGGRENDYETAYVWAAKQAPDQVANLIAKALLNGHDSSNSFDEQFEKSMELAEKYDDPAIVTEFARHHNPQSAYEKFKTPDLRAKMNELRQALAPKNN